MVSFPIIQRPNTAESGKNAVESKAEDGVQKREGKKISPAKLQRRLSVSYHQRNTN